MKNLIFVLFASLVFVSCGTKETVKEPTASVEAKKVVAPDAKLDFSDPSRMAGSSFAPFLISIIRYQDYDKALKFTSKESIDKFGADKIRDLYYTFKFNYNLKQKSISKEGDKFTLVYATNEMATGKLKKITVVVENDSCKLVLPDNLDDFMK